MRERNPVSDQRLDTLAHMQYPRGTADARRVGGGRPDGTYVVTVSVGDAAAT